MTRRLDSVVIIIRTTLKVTTIQSIIGTSEGSWALQSPKYELWDGPVGKVTAIIDSQQIHRRGKQYKCFMHGYSSYEYEWINRVNLPQARILIKAFEARKVAEAQAAAHVKANKPARRQSTTSKKWPPLIEDNDIEVDDGLVTRSDDEPTNPLDMSRYTKPTKNKRRMIGFIHVRH